VTRLAGKTALITGGGTGIGRACALLFAREGARVAVAGRSAEPLRAVVAEIERAGGQALAVTCDVTQAQQVERAVRATVERFGALNVVVNNAGVLTLGSVEQTPESEWARVLGVNLTGTFLVSRAALPELRKAGGGSIVNIGSLYGLIGLKNRAAYAASKGGVAQLTRSMALDHAHEGIRVNCVCPAIVETEMIQQVFASQPDPAALRRQRIEQIPLGRMGRPEDVAQLALFLASDESSWMTGVALPLDGGLSAG
jgi:NAD(P)-dependent dehydrogenase (short-subunit alcohol dehydrogenase family)